MAREIHVRAGLEIRQIILAASIYCIGSTCLCTNELSGIAAVIIIINSMSVAHVLWPPPLDHYVLPATLLMMASSWSVPTWSMGECAADEKRRSWAVACETRESAVKSALTPRRDGTIYGSRFNSTPAVGSGRVRRLYLSCVAGTRHAVSSTGTTFDSCPGWSSDNLNFSVHWYTVSIRQTEEVLLGR
jgi:hypothetical protein